jgi:serine/threonine protein phosphatase PrpC
MYCSSNAVIRRTAVFSVAYLLPAIYLLNDHNSAPSNENVNIAATNGNDGITVTSMPTSSVNTNSNNICTVVSTTTSAVPTAHNTTSAPAPSVMKNMQQAMYRTIDAQKRILGQIHPDLSFHSNRLLQQYGERQSLANYFNFWNIHLLSRAYCDGKGTNQVIVQNAKSNQNTTAVSAKPKVPLDPSLFLPSINQHDPSQSSCRKIANATYPANNPSEDRSVYGSKNGWAYGAVFDGHGGWQISDISSRVLLNLIFNKIVNTKAIDEILIDKQITESFQEMEDIILESIRPAFQFGFSEVGKVGSCVLIALKKDDHLIVANCGDCRAVLGSIDSQSNSQPTKLNREHNCREALEQIDLKRDHPNEADIVVCKNSHACYVKGRLQLTRSLGDAYLKYREFNGSPDKTR